MRGFPYIAEPYVERWSNRPPHLNHEGGALNADYTTVDALCAIANHLGKHGLEYNRDWYWEGRGWNFTNNAGIPTVRLSFAKQEYTLLLPLVEDAHDYISR